MARLIILLLLLAALIVLALQNLSTGVPLVLLSSKTSVIPLGLLLVGAIGLGALLTLIIYGLVGLRRPAESKYRPLGRRVPYPDGSSGSFSNSSAGSADSSAYPAAGTTAFVSDPGPAASSAGPSGDGIPSPYPPYRSTYPEDRFQPPRQITDNPVDNRESASPEPRSRIDNAFDERDSASKKK